MSTTTAPAAVTRYLEAADAADIPALADCFTPNGTVTDEGLTYTGWAEIAGWREAVAGRFTYTSTVTSSTPVDASTHRVGVRIDGDFPGGTADLVFTFTLRDGLVSALVIG